MAGAKGGGERAVRAHAALNGCELLLFEIVGALLRVHRAQCIADKGAGVKHPTETIGLGDPGAEDGERIDRQARAEHVLARCRDASRYHA